MKFLLKSCHCEERFLRRSNLCVRKIASLHFVSLAMTLCVQAQELRDVKPPVNQPFELVRPDTRPFWLFILCLGLIALGFFIYKRIKNKPNKNIQNELPQRHSWEIAYEELELLKEENLLTKGLHKEYYVKLSDIVRHYLEGRYNLRAPEMTTEEFLHSLKFSTDLSALHKEALKNFLNACDMVKFAKHNPDLIDSEKSFHFAKKLVDDTVPVAIN